MALTDEACHTAGQALIRYRGQRGVCECILLDFLIGAHAAVRYTRLLTRDRGFHRDSFPRLEIVDPSA